MSEDKKMADVSELPAGTVILTSAQPTDKVNVDVALDLARRGASPLVVRVVGGASAVHRAKVIAKATRSAYGNSSAKHRLRSK